MGTVLEYVPPMLQQRRGAGFASSVSGQLLSRAVAVDEVGALVLTGLLA